MPNPVAAAPPVHTAVPPVADTAGVTGHAVELPMFCAAGSDDRNITPTLEFAMPLAGIAGQLAAVGVPSGTRPNVRRIEGLAVARDRDGDVLGPVVREEHREAWRAMFCKNDGVATVKSQPTEPWLAAAA